jgi:hypothetical protein
MNLSDAYRQAFNADKMKPSTIHNRACSLYHDHEDVKARIGAILEQNKHKVSHDPMRIRQYVVERLLHESANAEQAGARVKALELLGKVDKVNVFGSHEPQRNGDLESLKAELEARLAKALNIKAIA